MSPTAQLSISFLVLAACTAASSDSAGTEAPCNHVCRELHEDVQPDYVPHNWCHTIAEESRLLEGVYTCTHNDRRLETGMLMELEVSNSDMVDSLEINTIDVFECIEVVGYLFDLSLRSSAVSVDLRSVTEIWKRSDPERTDSTVLYDTRVGYKLFKGPLFADKQVPVSMDILSYDDIGTARTWTVSIGNDFDERYMFECE